MRQRLVVTVSCVLATVVAVTVVFATTGRPPTQPTGPVVPTPTVPADVVIPSAWLTLGQLPFNATVHWRHPDTDAVTVMAGPENNIGTCLSGDPAAFGASRTWQLGSEVDGGQPPGSEQVFSGQYFLDSPADAERGLQSIMAAYGRCQTAPPGGVRDTVRTVASISGGFAVLRTIRTAGGQPASTAVAGSDSHEYVVARGSVIYFLGLYGTPAIDATDQDSATLTAMQTVLAQY
jgi:hypothetical protein